MKVGCIDLIAGAALYAFALTASHCASVDTYPRRACLYDEGRRFNTGTVIEKRGDGAVLFKYDDSTEGDHGYKWIDSDDRALGPCKAIDMDRFSAEHP